MLTTCGGLQMTHTDDIPYSILRRDIVKWIREGEGTVTPKVVGQVLREQRENYPGQITMKEIEILERHDEWQGAHREICIAFPKPQSPYR